MEAKGRKAHFCKATTRQTFNQNPKNGSLKGTRSTTELTMKKSNHTVTPKIEKPFPLRALLDGEKESPNTRCNFRSHARRLEIVKKKINKTIARPDLFPGHGGVPPIPSQKHGFFPIRWQTAILYFNTRAFFFRSTTGHLTGNKIYQRHRQQSIKLTNSSTAAGLKGFQKKWKKRAMMPGSKKKLGSKSGGGPFLGNKQATSPHLVALTNSRFKVFK